MDLDQLEAFVSVATLGGFTRASAQLHRSQPAASRRVALLESSLGVRLLERRGRSVALTREGEALLAHAQTALAAIRDGIDAVHDTRAAAGGPPLSIAVVGTLADQRLTVVLEHLRADHALAGRTIRSGRQLADVHFLSFPMDAAAPDSFGAMLQRELAALGLAEPRVTYVDSLTAQKRLVEAGYGVALLPLGACRDEIRAGTLTVLKVASARFAPGQPVVAVHRRSASRRAASFIEILRASRW